jgi:hypothetical protein
MRTVVVLLSAVAFLAAEGQSVQAQVSSSRNPWCIRDGIGGRGSWDCSYYNMQQCLDSASGAGGWCTQNPNYVPRKAKPQRKQQQRY